jgi:hypothetical protein
MEPINKCLYTACRTAFTCRRRATRRTIGAQRRPTRSTGPPRFIGVPGRTASRATAPATGLGRSTTPALATQPTGYSTYWQYTTALAFSVLAATKPVISSADNAIESFMTVFLHFEVSGWSALD